MDQIRVADHSKTINILHRQISTAEYSTIFLLDIPQLKFVLLDVPEVVFP